MRKFNFKQAGGARKYRPWKQWAEGDYIICKYKGTYTDKFRNECWEVETIESSFEDTDAEFSEGQVVGLNSAGGLAYALEEATPGCILRIEYTGQDVLQSGDYKGSEVHTFKVGIDDSTLDAEEIKAVQDATKPTSKPVQESEDDYDL